MMAHCSLLGSTTVEVHGILHFCGVAMSSSASSSKSKRPLCDMGFIKHDKPHPGVGQLDNRKLSVLHQRRARSSTTTRGMPSETSASGGPLSPAQPPPPSPSSLQVPADRAESLVAGAVSAISAPLAQDSISPPSSTDSKNASPLDHTDSAQVQGASGRSGLYLGVDDSALSRGFQNLEGEGTLIEGGTSGNPRAVWTTLLASSPAKESSAMSVESDDMVGNPEAVWGSLLAAIGKVTKDKRLRGSMEESSANGTLSSSPPTVQDSAPSSSAGPLERLASEGLQREGSRGVLEPARGVVQEERGAAVSQRTTKGVVSPAVPDVKGNKAVTLVSTRGKGGAEGEKELAPSRIRKVHSREQMDQALRLAGESLVVVQFAGKTSKPCKAMFPEVVELSRSVTDTIFLMVVGDESKDTRELCKNLGVRHPPHFTFFRSGRRIHDMNAATPEELQASILYYNDKFAPLVQQLESVEAWEALVAENKKSDKLAVVDISMHQCGPCVRVYPTVINLSRKMSDIAVFARVVGDENDSTKDLLRQLDIVEVPTFLFLRHGELVGRYVGSGKGELIGEILRHQGVRITY